MDPDRYSSLYPKGDRREASYFWRLIDISTASQYQSVKKELTDNNTARQAYTHGLEKLVRYRMDFSPICPNSDREHCGAGSKGKCARSRCLSKRGSLSILLPAMPKDASARQKTDQDRYPASALGCEDCLRVGSPRCICGFAAVAGMPAAAPGVILRAAISRVLTWQIDELQSSSKISPALAITTVPA
jgi:hypothetical protein